MIEYRGFTFPKDIWLFFCVPAKIIYFSRQINTCSPKKLIKSLKSKNQLKHSNCIEDMRYIEKLHKLTNYLLINIFKFKRKCYIKSCILFEEATKRGLKTEILIGAKKEGAILEGHCWIEIDGVPFNENIVELEKYTVMLRE